jgi:WD40 repeat protein
MIFAPQNSVVRNVCYQIPRWIQKCPITPPIWGTELQTLEGHSHSVNSVAFSHDSKLLASASRDNTVKIWDTSTGSLQQTLEGHSDWVTSVAFSHDSKLLASASRDKTVKIWDTSTGSLQQTVRVNSYIWTLLFDSTDSSLITDIGLIKVNKTELASLSNSFQKGSGKSNYEGLSVSGSWVVWNAQNLLWLPPNYRGPDIAVSPSCSTVAIGCQSGKVVVIGFSLVTLHNS